MKAVVGAGMNGMAGGCRKRRDADAMRLGAGRCREGLMERGLAGGCGLDG